MEVGERMGCVRRMLVISCWGVLYAIIFMDIEIY